MRVLLEADKISADERRTCMREMKDCQQRLWRMKTADDDETGTHARQPAELVAQCLTGNGCWGKVVNGSRTSPTFTGLTLKFPTPRHDFISDPLHPRVRVGPIHSKSIYLLILLIK